MQAPLQYDSPNFGFWGPYEESLSCPDGAFVTEVGVGRWAKPHSSQCERHTAKLLAVAKSTPTPPEIPLPQIYGKTSTYLSFGILISRLGIVCSDDPGTSLDQPSYNTGVGNNPVLFTPLDCANGFTSINFWLNTAIFPLGVVSSLQPSCDGSPLTRVGNTGSGSAGSFSCATGYRLTGFKLRPNLSGGSGGMLEQIVFTCGRQL